MFVETRNVEECTSCMESVLFNSDSLFRIACYLPADGLLNLALTCRRFGIGCDDSSSLVEETARRVLRHAATDEEMAALPGYDGDNWLSKYNYLRSLRAPLTFDQLVGGRIEYAEGNKSRVVSVDTGFGTGWATAFSNNIMMAGKHYVSFEVHHHRTGLFLGVIRPGEAMQNAKGSPLWQDFYNNFTQRKGSVQYNNIVNCCMYRSFNGHCWSSDWEGIPDSQTWDGMEEISSPCKIGMLLDLDKGTMSVYKDGRKLGVMKRGLAGHYCWFVSLPRGTRVTIKRETVPAS